MRNALLIALVLIGTLVTGVDARKDRKNDHKEKRERILVVDQTAPEWDGVVWEIVNEFNAAMPKHGPKLVYADSSEVNCQDITICHQPLPPGYLGVTWVTPRDFHGPILLTDQVTPIRKEMRRIVCHELMHKVGKLPDAYTRLPNGTAEYWYPHMDSCIWNDHDSLGSFDIQTLRDVHGKKK
jgi:hypothetical protein